MNSVFSRRIAGFALIVAFVGGAVLALARPSNPFADRHAYYAVFDTAQGLGAIDRDVRIAGAKVGEIGEVERRGDDVRVALILYQDFALHSDARVQMRPHTLFEGSNFVDLEPGSPSAPVIDEGATIPRAQTANYVTLDEALRVLRPDIRDNLKTLARVGSRTFRDEAVDGVQQTLRSAPALTQSLDGAAAAAGGTHGEELAGSVHGLSRTVDALERRAGELAPLVGHTERTAAALTVDAGRPLDATLAALPATLREVRVAAPEVTEVVHGTRRLARELTPALPAVRDALHETVPVLRRVVPLAPRATPVIRDARLIAGRLARARSALVEMFELTGPSLAKFDSLFEVFNTKSPLGAPSGVSQLVGGAFSGFNAVFRPFQTPAQDPMAPGHKGRIGVHVAPAGLLGLTESLGGGAAGQASPLLRGGQPSCRSISAVSRRAAEQIRSIGACK